MDYIDRVRSFDDIEISVTEISSMSVKGNVSFRSGEDIIDFPLIFSFSEDIEVDENMAGMMLTMPAINFTYFSKNLTLDFDVSAEDLSLLSSFLKINAREVFVNKICRRRYEFILPDYIPEESEISPETADGRTTITAKNIISKKYHMEPDYTASIVLSSGGKESLLTYGLMNDAGSKVYSAFFNESGGHWRTAKTSYDFYVKNFENVVKVWSNVDRFYHFVLRKLKILDQNVVKRIADTYPIQLFIFPVYVFSIIPFLIKYHIGSVLMGNEFDDPRDMPDFKGLKHYYGVFDQSNDFSDMITDYLSAKGINSRLWSAVYPISGNLVEEILIRRYPNLFRLQRSCHSCHFRNGSIVPCAKCTKCFGVMMFVLNARGNPEEIGYLIDDIDNLETAINNAKMRLDSDELEYLKNSLFEGKDVKSELRHVRGIHILPKEKQPLDRIPEIFKDRIFEILLKYADGIYKLPADKWVQMRAVT